MKKKYLYNGTLIDEADVMDAAKQSNLDLNSYIQKAGMKPVDDTYSYQGKDVSAEDILDAANQSKLGFDDYIQKAGFQKKNQGGNGLSVGADGHLQNASPIVSKSKGNGYDMSQTVPEYHTPEKQSNPYTVENNFGMPTGQTANQNISDNTNVSTSSKIDTQNIGFQKAAFKKQQEQNQKVRDAAINNTVQKSLKLKGLNAQPGSLLYNIEKSTYNQQLDNGNASIGVDQNGNVGLKRTTGALESAKIGWHNAINGNKEADEFVNNMTPAQQVDFLNKKQKEQDEYVGTQPTEVGSLTGKVAENAPFLGKAGLGYLIGAGSQMLAPETLGLSELGLAKAGSFIATAGDMQNQTAFKNIASRYQVLQHQHPDWTPEQAMTEANKDKNLDKAQGLVINYLFNENLGGNKPIVGEARNTIVNNVKGMIKSAAEGAGKVTGVQAVRDVSDNAKGIGSGHQLDDLANEFVDNFGTIGLLHAVTGAVTGAFKLPKLFLSSAKNVLAKENPEQINSILDANVKAGNLTPEDAQKVTSDVSQFSQNLQKVPDGASDEVKTSIAGLMQKRDNIDAEAKTKDQSPAIQQVYKDQKDAINNQISDVLRTGKPLEHEVDEATAQTYEKPTFDNIAALKVKNLADKISKGKEVTNPEDLQAEQNFPDELKSQLDKIIKEEKSANKGKETPKTDLTDNIQKYLDEKQKSNVQQPTEIKSTPNESTSETSLPTAGKIYVPEEKVNVKPNGDNIQVDQNLQTLGFGKFAGKPENDENKATTDGQIKQGNIPIGDTGETFDNFIERTIKTIQPIIEKDPNNTVVSTHSANIKAIQTWDAMGRPNIEDIQSGGKLHDEFVDKYLKAETKEGNVYKLDTEGKTILLSRHGETEDNVKQENGTSNFRRPDAQLTDSGIKEAEKAGQKIKEITGGEVPKIYRSPLDRSGETTNIINNVLNNKENATDIRSHTGQGNVGGNVVESGKDQSSENIQLDAGQKAEPTEVKQQTGNGQPPINEEETKVTGEEENTVGVHHEALSKLSKKLGLEQPETGDVFTPAEYAARGQKLIDAGADPLQIAKDFENDGKVNADIISVTKAHLVNLVRIANDARKQFGANSEEYQKAKNDVDNWARDVAKPMGTKFGEIGRALQGETDIDTGNFVSMQRAVEDKTGKPLSKEQEQKITELTKVNEELNNKNKELTKKLSDALSGKETGKPNREKLSTQLSDIAKRLRTSSEFDNFLKGANGDVLKSGIDLPTLKEIAASVLEDTAKAVAAGENAIDFIREAVSKIKEDVDKEGLIKSLTDIGEKAGIFDVNNAKEKPVELAKRFVDKKDSKFDPKDAKDIWSYAKENYIDKDRTYVEMLQGVSKDLGLSFHQVREALSQPKAAKEITDEIYRLQNKRQLAINKAKEYVRTVNQTKAGKFIRALPNAFFRLKVFGHGTVGGITHAGMNIFQPSRWKIYWPFFFKQFKYSFGSTAEYEKAMEDLKNDPDFTFWKRNGLAVDPKEIYDDYQSLHGLKPSSNPLVKFFNRLGVAGDRGFNALKVYRLDLAKSFYDKLSDVEKADPETAKNIAQLVNHSTGTTEVNVPKWVNTALFAPKLEVSRWQSLITDPAKAANTYLNWKNATAAEKVRAKIVAKNAGEKIATYMTCLAANSAILSLTGSKQSINYFQPTRNDWLKFKAGDKTIDVSGGMEATMRFVGSLVNELRIAYSGDKEDFKSLHGDKPQDKDYKTIGQQLRYKMSPFLSTLTDLVTGTDAMGRPLPFTNIKPPKGTERYSVGGYLLQQQTPIPISEGIREAVAAMKQNGMNDNMIIDMLKGFGQFVVSGGTGAKVADDYSVTEGGSGGGGGATSLTNYGEKIPLNKDQQKQLQDMKDQLKETDLNNLKETDTYKSASDDEKAKLERKFSTNATDKAEEEFKKLYPDQFPAKTKGEIRQELRDSKLLKKEVTSQ